MICTCLCCIGCIHQMFEVPPSPSHSFREGSSAHLLSSQFIHTQNHSCTHTLNHSCTHTLDHSFTNHTLNHSFTIHTLNHSCTHTLNHSCTHTRNHSCTLLLQTNVISQYAASLCLDVLRSILPVYRHGSPYAFPHAFPHV